jgi:shikimate dehydrogenase
MSRPYAEVIGDPIAHSKSPLIHNFWLNKLGIDAEYRSAHVCAAELSDYLAKRRQDRDWRGCNVTIPHKEAVIAYIDSLLPGAMQIGAINTVISSEGQLFGANTDIAGIIGPLNAFFGYSPPPHQRVAIIGAGGAARAAAAALTSYFPNWPIRFLARRFEQAEAIAHMLEITPDIRPIEDTALLGVTLLINASPLGMIGKTELNLSLAAIQESENPKIIFDMVYAPLETPLLAEARRKAFAALDGLQMLVSQAAEAFELLFRQAAPREYDDELRTLLVK